MSFLVSVWLTLQNEHRTFPDRLVIVFVGSPPVRRVHVSQQRRQMRGEPFSASTITPTTADALPQNEHVASSSTGTRRRVALGRPWMICAQSPTHDPQMNT